MTAQARPSILIVEDERIVAKDLQQTLLDMGYDAYAIASSAEEAVACANRRRPDVVLMDIRIKGQEDGIATAAILKNLFPVSIIYLTAHADESMIDRAKRTEPFGYLLKPVKAGDLRSMIEIATYKREIDRVRERLRASEQRVSLITDNVPVSIGYFDREGRVQFANRAFREMTPAHDDGLGVPASTFLGAFLHKESYGPRQRALAGEQVNFILKFEHKGVLQQHEMTYLPERDADGVVVGVYSLGYDVTEREQLGAELNQARVDLEAILNNVPASITSWRTDLTNRFANRAAEAEFGVAPGGAAGKPMGELLGDERYRSVKASVEAALAGQRSTSEQTYRGDDDAVRHLHDDYVAEIKDGAVVGLYVVTTDTTALHRSHEKVRELAQRLETVREEERRKVAVILHDGIAQDLFAMKLGLSHLEALGKRRAGIKKMCKELTVALAACMDDTRQLANDLRPLALTYFNLATVISDHARHFQAYSNLIVKVTEIDHFPKLDETAQLLFFRAAQEALTNVARHAEASAVEIRLRSDGDRLTMEVSDDGKGIDETAMNKPRSLGLLGLRERFVALGGGLTAQRRTPKGTTVTVYLPKPADAAIHAA
jgi:PAS domain S-box-containing protein